MHSVVSNIRLIPSFNAAVRTYSKQPIWPACDLKTVKPHSFFGYSFPCQKSSALLRNRTIRSIKNGNDSEVALRYLESRFKFKFHGALSAIESLSTFFLFLPNCIPAYIHYRCFRRDLETCSIAENHLKNISLEGFSGVKKLNYICADKDTVNKLFKENK